MKNKSRKKRVKVVKIVPLPKDHYPEAAAPVYEIVQHVESPVPPPELLEASEFHELLTTTSKKRGFWDWLLH